MGPLAGLELRWLRDFLTVTRFCHYRYRHSHVGPRCIRYGRRTYYDLAELIAWVRKNRIVGTG